MYHERTIYTPQVIYLHLVVVCFVIDNPENNIPRLCVSMILRFGDSVGKISKNYYRGENR